MQALANPHIFFQLAVFAQIALNIPDLMTAKQHASLTPAQILNSKTLWEFAPNVMSTLTPQKTATPASLTNALINI